MEREMDKPPQWAIARALDLGGVPMMFETDPASRWVFTLAHYIALHENPPLDPDVLAVREILASFGCTHIEGGDRNGQFQAGLAAYRKHRA